MENANHNPKVYTPEQVANLVDRTPRMITNYCKEGRIEHTKFGRMFMITELGLKQAKQIVRNSKPGRPKGSKDKTRRQQRVA